MNKFHHTITSAQVLEPGKHTLVFEFKYDGGGLGKGATGTLSTDGKQIAQGRIEHTVPIRYSLDEGLDVGEDAGTPVNLNYDVHSSLPARCTKSLWTSSPKTRRPLMLRKRHKSSTRSTSLCRIDLSQTIRAEILV